MVLKEGAYHVSTYKVNDVYIKRLILILIKLILAECKQYIKSKLCLLTPLFHSLLFIVKNTRNFIDFLIF